MLGLGFKFDKRDFKRQDKREFVSPRANVKQIKQCNIGFYLVSCSVFTIIASEFKLRMIENKHMPLTF